MKRRLLILLITATFALSACKSADSKTLINAENYGGIMYETAATAAAPLPIPEISTASKTEATTDIISEAPEVLESSTESDAPSANVSTTEAADMTTATAATTKITAAVTTTTTAATTTSTTTTTAKPIESYNPNGYSALNYDTVRGVWISYIELADILMGKTEAQFTAAIGKAYDNCVNMGLNTVYVHVRPFGDAIYSSSLYPWSQSVTGTYGKAGAFDPLAIMVSEAHKRKLSFQAWINPLRCCTGGQITSAPTSTVIGQWYNDADKRGKYIVKVENYWYLNPAYDEVLQLVEDGVREITSGYDVDGIHIDDYFYPTTDAGFDSSAYSASGYTSLAKFRTDKCNKLIEKIYGGMKAVNKTALFGASTQGNNNSNLNILYADVAAWCKAGTVDYLAPQIYYGFNNQVLPFKSCVDEWAGIVSGSDVKLIIGLAVYKCGNEDTWAGTGKTEWQNSSDVLKRQVEYVNGKSACDGIILYSYNYVFNNAYQNSVMKKEIEAIKLLL